MIFSVHLELTTTFSLRQVLSSSASESVRVAVETWLSSSSTSSGRNADAALVAQVRQLSAQLTKQGALNAELQRQIVDLNAVADRQG